MSEEIAEETAVVSEEDEVPEMTIEERQEALKKSRWNVFMYLGLAVVLFGFALYPFMSLSLYVDEGVGSIEETVTVWAIPIPGEDITDIPVEIEVIVQAIPTDIQSIEVFMIENKKGCSATDGSIQQAQTDLRNEESKHPNNYYVIEDPVESQSYEIDFKADPGIYCIRIVVASTGEDFSGVNVESEIDMYPNQFPLALIGAVSLVLSAFAFIGAQKNGKFVKSLIEPKEEPSIEETVLAQTTSARITAGPSGPPIVGPTGPPPSGPTGPPQTGPSGPPVTEIVPAVKPEAEVEAEAEAEAEVEAEAEADVFEDQGEGWFFRKLPDGSYDQAVYVIEDGQYVPYVDPDA
jgi:hypothetical protein